MKDQHGLSILVDPREEKANQRPYEGEDLLVRWVTDRVNQWERDRNSNYLERWDEFYRIWRCEWTEEDKTRQVERSKLMPTDLSEAVQKATSEMQDAFFGRENWLDASDNFGDGQNQDVKDMAKRLREDADQNGVKSALGKAMFYGALYGTGILKIAVGTKEVAVPTSIVDNFGRQVLGGATVETQPYIHAVPVSPREFVIETGARSIDEAIGCAHITDVPRHTVLEGQRSGVFKAGKIPAYEGQGVQPYDIEQLTADADQVRLIEYHGKVSAALLPGKRARGNNRRKIVDGEIDASVEMVEAIVVIANDATRLKAVANPFTLKDRSIVAFQYESVPDSFYGRGVVEAGYHPYKALQTEIRARADGLGLANYPTVWRDEASFTGESTRDDPDEAIIVPGKEYVVAGNPSNAIKEFKFSGPNPQTSVAIADYQRMIESATGSFGFQGALASSKDSTVAGSSMALQSFMRRSKQTAFNIERNLISPAITKMAWRSMQFMPGRYPPIDFSFKLSGAMGVLQRDAERATLIELLSAIPPESPAYYAILQLVVEDGPYNQRQELMAILDGIIAQLLNPPPPPRDLGGEARLLSAEQRVKEHADEMALALEKLKREDAELLIKARGATKTGEGGSAPRVDDRDININLSTGKKRVKIKRGEDGSLVGETEEMNED